ncbi:MAG: LysM domain-containing protein [Deltaproteobacteria bacterium]|nr:MAG: LysM domain-containing protein [Deltaproteobacteria bacterium]
MPILGYIEQFLGKKSEQESQPPEHQRADDQDLLGNQEVLDRASSPSAPGGGPPDEEAQALEQAFTYTCDGTETYSSLAKRAGGDWNVLRELNPEQDERRLSEGTILRLPAAWAGPFGVEPQDAAGHNPDFDVLVVMLRAEHFDEEKADRLLRLVDKLSEEEVETLRRDHAEGFERLMRATGQVPEESGFFGAAWETLQRAWEQAGGMVEGAGEQLQSWGEDSGERRAQRSLQEHTEGDLGPEETTADPAPKDTLSWLMGSALENGEWFVEQASDVANVVLDRVERARQGLGGLASWDLISPLPPQGSPDWLVEQASQSTRDSEAEVPVQRTYVELPQERATYLKRLDGWLRGRLDDVLGLEGEARLGRVQGILETTEELLEALAGDVTYDIEALQTKPSPNASTASGVFAPPSLIPILRDIIAVGDATAIDIGEGASFVHGIDWSKRLGVPRYLSQNDNLSASTASCNVTSQAMVYQRLGYGREDLVRVLREEMETYFRAELKRKGIEDEEAEGLVKEALPEYMVETVKRYLDAVAADGRSSGRKIRSNKANDGSNDSGAQGEQRRRELAEDFLLNADLPDLLDLLVQLSFNSADREEGGRGFDSTKMGARNAVATYDTSFALLSKLSGSSEKELSAGWSKRQAAINHIDKPVWSRDKHMIKECLEEGGAAILSIRHYARQNGKTHMTSCQQVTAAGAIIDDPYGKVSGRYSHKDSARNAYAYTMDGGAINAIETSEGDEWHWSSRRAIRQDASASEGVLPVERSHGASVELSDKTLEECISGLRFFRKGARAPGPAEEAS